MINFQFLTEEAIPFIVEAFHKNNWLKPRATFDKYFKEQQEGRRIIWLAYCGEELAGYITLCWQSHYQPFQKENIPEIKDLNVLPPFRCQGIASQLLKKAEEEAFKKSPAVGIGVGLYLDYGTAQKLYVKHGYIPDGKGITYNYQPIVYGDTVRLDDDLILWFTKKVG